MLILSPIIGYLSDYYGRRKVILVGMGIYVTSLGLYMADGHWLILSLARILEGIANVSIGLVAMAAVQDIVDNKKRVSMPDGLSACAISRVSSPLYSPVYWQTISSSKPRSCLR